MRVRWRSYLLVGVQFSCLAVLGVTGPLLATRGMFLIMELGGLGLGIWALASMSPRSLHVLPDIKEGGQLVTNGPYRVIRHPMYAALLVVTLALVLDTLTIGRCAVWFLLLGDLLIKLQVEERLLARHYDAYRAYQARTYRLLPWIF